MGVADRVRQRKLQTEQCSAQTADGSLPDSRGMSSLALVDNRPDIDRLKGLIGMMRRTIEEHNDGSGLARFAFILTSFTDELAEEFRDMDEMQIRLYLYKVESEAR